MRDRVGREKSETGRDKDVWGTLKASLRKTQHSVNFFPLGDQGQSGALGVRGQQGASAQERVGYTGGIHQMRIDGQ